MSEQHRPTDIQGWMDERVAEYGTPVSRELRKSALVPDHDEVLSRAQFCGIGSEIVKRDLELIGFDVQLKKLSLDPPARFKEKYDGFEHVVATFEDETGKYIVDSTYSQFFAPFGLDVYLDKYNTADSVNYSNPYPKEKILVLPESDIEIAAQWAADIALLFQQREGFSTRYQYRHGYQTHAMDNSRMMRMYFNHSRPRRDYTFEEAKHFFLSVWDTSRFTDFDSGDHVVDFVNMWQKNSSTTS